MAFIKPSTFQNPKDVYDASNMPTDIPARQNSAGTATLDDHMSRFTLSTDHTKPSGLIVCPWNRGPTFGVLLSYDGVNYTADYQSADARFPTTGPTSGSCVRATVIVRNLTNRLGVGSTMYVHRLVGRVGLPYNGTNVERENFLNSVMANEKTRSVTGLSVSDHGYKISCLPTDGISYEQFAPWDMSNNDTWYSSTIYDSPPSGPASDHLAARSMSGVLLVFPVDVVGSVQTYEITLRVQWLHRWPETDLLFLKQIPLVDSATKAHKLHNDVGTLLRSLPEAIAPEHTQSSKPKFGTEQKPKKPTKAQRRQKAVNRELSNPFNVMSRLPGLSDLRMSGNPLHPKNADFYSRLGHAFAAAAPGAVAKNPKAAVMGALTGWNAGKIAKTKQRQKF